MARHYTMTVGSLLTDGDSSKNLAMHQSLIDALVTQMKDFLMEHKEFDSYAGLQRLRKDPDYLASVANVICDVYKIPEG